MEVSQIAGLDTHAIIGGGKAHAFTMSESAEFFTVLSDTLYRDKKRAVVREVVCNAYDAHIAAGKRDLPIEITITDTELVIKDFGAGIPADKVGSIYCRYGASTKVKDENQTGGFGLGSKAPFAYSDHFSVTTCNAGFRHVYAISRGGAETDGKPDFRQMVKVKTEETGVTVSIPLKSVVDRVEFEKIALSVVRQGGMVAKLNGTLLERYEYDKATTSFILVPSTELRESQVYCLYGTVLYPVQTTDTEIQALLRKCGNLVPSDMRLVVIAPANSVGVTPSRESLSYTDTTKATLTKLMEHAHSVAQRGMKPVARQVVRDAAAKIAKTGASLWNRTLNRDDYMGFVAHIVKQSSSSIGTVVALDDICRFLAAHHINSLVSDQTKVLRKEFAKLRRDDRRIFRRAAGSKYNPPIDGFRIDNRLNMRIANSLNLHRNMYVFELSGYMENAKPYRVDMYDSHGNRTIAKPHIYVGFSQRDIIKQIGAELPKKRTYFSETYGYVAFVLRRNQHGMIDQIKAAAARYKLKVVECAITAPPKRAKKLPEDARFLSFKDLKPRNKAQPEASLVSAKYYVTSVNDYNYSFGVGPLTDYVADVTKYFGDVAVAENMKDEAKLKAMGAVHVIDAMADFLIANIKKKEVLYAANVESGFLPSCNYREPAHLIEKLAKYRVASDWFFPPKTKLTDIFEKVKFFSKMLNLCMEGRYVRKKVDLEASVAIKNRLHAFNKEARAAYAHLRLTRKELNEKFSYLQPLANVFSYGDFDNEEPAEQMMTLIKILARRHQAALEKAKVSEAAKVAAQTKTPSTALVIYLAPKVPAIIYNKEAA